MLRFTLILFLSVLIFNTKAQTEYDDCKHLLSEVRNYTVYKTISEISVDGKPDETSWEKADWSEYFQDIEGDKKPTPKYNTRFKMLWDNQYLYILAELEEPHVWAYYTERDMIVYHENDFEFFIDPNGDTHNYFEFEINAQNTVMDLFMPKPYRNGGKFDLDWDADGFQSSVHVNGTLNDPSDIDKSWTVEMAIPFSALKVNDEYLVPKNGDHWKINFSRVQWQTEIVDGKYQKIKDTQTGRFLHEDNWVWSKQGVINMHLPERWGIAAFSTQKVGGAKVEFVYPDEEILGKYLWLVYYKQHDYKKQNNRFASSLKEIGLEKEIETKIGEKLVLSMHPVNNGFKAILENNKGLKLSIDQNGLFQSVKKIVQNE